MTKENLPKHQIGRYKEKITPKNLIEINKESKKNNQSPIANASSEVKQSSQFTESLEITSKSDYWGIDPVGNMQVLFIGSIILACFGLCYAIFPENMDSVLKVLFSGRRHIGSSGFEGFGEKARAIGFICIAISSCCIAYVRWFIKEYYKKT